MPLLLVTMAERRPAVSSGFVPFLRVRTLSCSSSTMLTSFLVSFSTPNEADEPNARSGQNPKCRQSSYGVDPQATQSFVGSVMQAVRVGVEAVGGVAAVGQQASADATAAIS
eukprot:7834795-Pyramimonas_sp.AAC.1